jgi:hypothetical protein
MMMCSDLRSLGVVDWKIKARNREEWRTIVKAGQYSL